MKQIYPLALLVATGAMLVTGTSLHASEMDDRIESSAKKSHVFNTHLKDDSIKTGSKNGVVTLSGIARHAAEKSLVTKLVKDIHGVTRVINNMSIGIAKN